MQTLLQRELMLYKTASSKTTDWDFSATLLDYFDFISGEGILLLKHLNEEIKERSKREDVLEEKFQDLEKQFTDTYLKLKAIIKKLQLEDHPIILDRMQDYESLLNNTQIVLGGNKYDSILSECGDTLRELEKLGHNKEIEEFIKEPEYKRKEFSFFDIKLHIALKECQAELATFQKKDRMSLSGAFARLAQSYGQLKHHKVDSISVTNYAPDLERIHNSILLHNEKANEEQSNETKTIFYTKDKSIFHFEIGKLSYDLDGTRDPKFIRIFKNIIEYMPAEKDKIRISEFEKLLPKHEQVENTYRANLGKSARSFQNFLKKNGVKNIHPETKEVVIHVTDEYITFRNNL